MSDATVVSQPQVFRFKLDDNMVSILYQFSKLHQHDDRVSYKEAWNLWVENNKEAIDREQRRLLDLGYEGDVIAKMYKSARYYFRKKPVKKEEPKARRKYVSGSGTLIEAMDDHIADKIMLANYRPSTGYDEFCSLHKELIGQEIHRFIQEGLTDGQEIQAKIKKTYKNRYFQYIKNTST